LFRRDIDACIRRKDGDIMAASASQGMMSVMAKMIKFFCAYASVSIAESTSLIEANQIDQGVWPCVLAVVGKQSDVFSNTRAIGSM
jgi:hypothetical protein